MKLIGTLSALLLLQIWIICIQADYATIPLFELEPMGTLKIIDVNESSHDNNSSSRVKRAAKGYKFKFEPIKRTVTKKTTQNQRDHKNSVLPNKDEKEEKLSLDILVVTDYSIYRHFLESTNYDEQAAIDAIYKYYTSVLYELTKMYSAQRLGYMRFKVYPVGIIISKKFTDAPWIITAAGKYANESMRQIDAFEVLKAFRYWIKQDAENLPQHDHAIAVTRYDLSRFADNNAQGIAYVRTICQVGQSVSVVEDVGAMATVAVASHELAHSLGAEHDGLKNTDGCHKTHNYLMVPAVSTIKDTLPNTFTFSECTIKQIKKHIFAPGRRAECLFHSPLENVGYYGLKNTNTNPGQFFDAHKQCKHAFGLQYSFCEDDDYYVKQLCRQLWCRNTTIPGRKPPCQSKPYLPALSGTSCGNRMWCVNGACVEDEKAPPEEGCKYGDRDSNFCIKLIHSNPSKCKENTFARFCCESCRQRKLRVYRKFRM